MKEKYMFGILMVFFILGCCLETQIVSAKSEYDDVMIVTNRNSTASIIISSYFMEHRGYMHQCNISTLNNNDVISDASFKSNILNPIKNCLNSLGENDVNYIVLTKGTPMKVTNVGCVYTVDNALSVVGTSSESLIGVSKPFGIDSLCMIYAVPNPYLNKNITGNSTSRTSNGGYYKVTRLTGYTVDEVLRNLIPHSNQIVLNGNFLIDDDSTKNTSAWSSTHQYFWNTKQHFESAGYNVIWDNTTKFYVNQKNLSGYISYGSNDGRCPTANSSLWNLSFNPGAMSFTYVSTSARSFEKGTTYGQSLLADQLTKWAYGGCGASLEPYTTGLLQPDKWAYMWVQGNNLADSYYNGLPYILWRNVVIGDPKLRLVKPATADLKSKVLNTKNNINNINNNLRG